MRKELVIGKKPPRGIACGLCAERCPTCGVKYGSLEPSPNHKPRCRNAARICGCENKAAIVVGDRKNALPVCRDHATKAWKHDLLCVARDAPGAEIASMYMDEMGYEWFVTIVIKRDSSFLSALARIIPLLPDHPALSYGFTRQHQNVIFVCGSQFYRSSLRKPRSASALDSRRYCKHCSKDMPRVGQRLCRDRDGDLCDGVVRKNRVVRL